MDPFLGEIKMVGFNFAPVGYAFCDGTLLPIQQNSALFALLGTSFGGNGTTNFAVPDLRSRVPIGFGQGPNLSSHSLGQLGGGEQVTITMNQMPSHTHPATGSVTPGANNGGRGVTLTNVATGNLPATAVSGTNIYATPANTQMGQSPVTVNVQASGQGLPVGILPPFQAVNFIIATTGIFPSRQ
jgi:microcystin-dependent protein